MASKIPPGFTATAVMDTAGLAEAIRRPEVVAARDTPVRVAFTPGQAELTAGSGDEASGGDTVACELDGDPLTVAFSPRLLLDAVTTTDGGRTRIALTGPGTPALITPAGADDGTGAGYRHLLMPRTVYEIDADDVGPSLKWSTAKIAKTARDKAPHPADTDDPWADRPAAADDVSDHPPF